MDNSELKRLQKIGENLVKEQEDMQKRMNEETAPKCEIKIRKEELVSTKLNILLPPRSFVFPPTCKSLQNNFHCNISPQPSFPPKKHCTFQFHHSLREESFYLLKPP